MTFTIGWWAVPAFITIAAFYVALREAPVQRGDYDFGSGFIALLFVAAALIISLIAWLSWALVA